MTTSQSHSRVEMTRYWQQQGGGVAREVSAIAAGALSCNVGLCCGCYQRGEAGRSAAAAAIPAAIAAAAAAQQGQQQYRHRNSSSSSAAAQQQCTQQHQSVQWVLPTAAHCSQHGGTFSISTFGPMLCQTCLDMSDRPWLLVKVVSKAVSDQQQQEQCFIYPSYAGISLRTCLCFILDAVMRPRPPCLPAPSCAHTLYLCSFKHTGAQHRGHH